MRTEFIRLQMKMLDILSSYLECAPEPLELLCALFYGVQEPDYRAIDLKWEQKTNGITFEDKQQILRYIHQRRNNRIIYAALIERVQFGDNKPLTLVSLFFV